MVSAVAVHPAPHKRALASEDPDEALNDIDFTEGEEESMPPELAATHEEFIPEDDGKP